MTTPAASAKSHTDSSSQTLDDHLPDSAQPTLAGLRAALESRLATLEEVLADPSRGESLEGLILDLSRAATEEAQAAASQACYETKAEADKQIAQILASARAALEQEQADSAELRRAIEQAQRQIATLEREKEAERGVREQIEAKLARARADTADLERAAEDTRKQLEAERASSADLRRVAERADERLATLGREASQSRAAREEFATELAREREAAANFQRAHAEAQSQLDKAARERAASERAAAEAQKQLEAEARATHEALMAELAREREAAATIQRALAENQSQLEEERASNRDLRLAVESADQRLSSAQSDRVQILADHEQLAAQLDRERAETARAAKGMVDAQLTLESARVEIPGLRAELDAARTRLEALATERDTIAGQLQAARQWIDAQREAEAEFALLSPQIETPSGDAQAPTHPAKHEVDAPAPSGDPGDGDEWQAVRLANRYVFREEIAVQINGEGGRLFDLSISGCQLLSPSALKPNHVVKVLLPSEQTSIACMGTVVWTRLEPSAAGRPLGYRAGVRFTKADESAIETFAALHGATV